jgi:ubiquinone biosynthesis protein UbiJ
MRRYRTPLPNLLARSLEHALNQVIALDPEAARHLEPLRGRSLCLQLQGLNIDLYLIGPAPSDSAARLSVALDSHQPVDTTISGSPSALLAMAVPAWRRPGSGVRIEGDVGVAQAIEGLMRRLDPDWETLCVDSLGVVVGHQAWRLLRSSLTAGRDLGGVAADQVGHFLREESDWLVSQQDGQQFSRSVDQLREATDRLEAALRRHGLS